MTPEIGILPVTDEEFLARYIVQKSHIRADGTVKADPLFPFSRVELSVTRHLGLIEEQIWDAGERVAKELGKSLIGRADVQKAVFVEQRLRVVPTPQPLNANHADVIDWPPDKPSQKQLALEIARHARFKLKV